MRLVQDGQSDYCLVRPAGAGLDFAADELARYLAIVSGASLPIADQAAGAALSLQLEPAEVETYGWRVSEGRVELFGSDRLNVLYAVYGLLETHCGCRWLAEFEGGEQTARLETLDLPLGECRFTPSFSHRAFTNYPAIDRETVAMVDWMAKHRFNRFMIFANMAGSFEAYQKLLRPELVARGMHVEMGHHSFRFFLPPEEYFAEHPEYYALLGGARSTEGQLCTSHPDVASLVARRVCDFLQANPEIGTVGLWPNDGYGWCECEQCTALEPQEPSWFVPSHPRRTDTYLRFVNEVAALVAREHPDRELSALAYVNYAEPPREVRPQENVRVCFAPFQRCFKHPLAGAEGAQALPCTRPNAEYARLLRQWRDLVPGGLYLFEYLMLIDMCSLPYPLTPILGRDLRDYAEAGVDGYVLEFKPEEWGPYGVNANLIGWLSWGGGARVRALQEGEGGGGAQVPALQEGEVEALLEDYYRAIYGPAAPHVRQYLARLEEDFVRPGPCVHHYTLEYARRATSRLLAPALSHLGEALAAGAAGERWQVQNVKRVQVGAQLLLRMGCWREALARARQAPPEEREALSAEARERGEELLAWVHSKRACGALDVAYLERRVQADLQ